MIQLNQGRARWRNADGKTYSVLFAGDICPRREGIALTSEGNSERVFADVKPLFDRADCRIVQWETTLTESEKPIDKSGPNLKVPPKCADLLPALGVDVALLANNHIGDFGPEAVMETIHSLHERSVKTVGAGSDLHDARKTLKFKIGDIPVTLINLCENEFGGAREGRAGTATFDFWHDMKMIRAAKKEGGLLFLALHGGHETNPFPSPRMRELFRAFIEAGADLVWNCHTHCPEGIELWQGKPIVYSPGNFYFPSMSVPSGPTTTWWCGYLTNFIIDKDGVCGLDIAPYQQYLDRMELLSGERLEQFWKYFKPLCDILDDPKQLQHQFDVWCCFSGLNYLSGYAFFKSGWEPDWNDRAEVKNYLGIRNKYTCESHNDMLTRTLRLIEQYEIEALKKEIPQIQALQEPEFLNPVY